jgi:uncharacterized protein YneF (UPF0154 family)
MKTKPTEEEREGLIAAVIIMLCLTVGLVLGIATTLTISNRLAPPAQPMVTLEMARAMLQENPEGSFATEIFEDRVAGIETPEKKVWVDLNGEPIRELFPDTEIRYSTAYWFNSDFTGKFIAVVIGLVYTTVLTPIALLFLKIGKLLFRPLQRGPA